MKITTANSQYNRRNMMRATHSFDRVPIPDPLDQRFEDLANQVSGYQRLVYDGGHITALAHRIYGSISAWWIILRFNGFQHPSELRPGMTLLLPIFNRGQFTGSLIGRVGQRVQI